MKDFKNKAENLKKGHEYWQDLETAGDAMILHDS
jgi:hypothetical protein